MDIDCAFGTTQLATRSPNEDESCGTETILLSLDLILRNFQFADAVIDRARCATG